MNQPKSLHLVCIYAIFICFILNPVTAFTADSAIGWTVGLTYADCRKMCERRVNCNNARYMKRYPLCVLYNADNIPSHEPGVTLITLEKSPAIVTLCSVCKDTYFCDISNTNEVICTPAQCQTPGNIPEAELMGNLLSFSSKAQYRCILTRTVHTIKCLPDGSWSDMNLLLCNCMVPDGYHHATTGFEMVNESYIALTLVCHSGYELLEMEKPKCNLLTGEWFGTGLSGCYMMRVPPWRKIFSYTTKTRGNIFLDFKNGESTHFSFANDMHKDGQFRNSTIFDNWSTFIFKRIQLEVVVNWTVVKYMVFNGTGSTWRNWFETSRLLDSSWTDLNSTTQTQVFSILGIQSTWTARFVISKYIDQNEQCELDSGWMVMCWGYYPCDTAKSGINILYAKGTTVAKFDSSELEFADRFEVWIEE